MIFGSANARWSLVYLAVLTAVSSGVTASQAAASDPPALESELGASARALEAGRPQAAIDRLEQLADQGIAHADLSFNRGLAYLRRATSSTPQVGDFGQAAAAFAEALQRRPDDAQASRALEETQLAAARKRAGEETTVSDPLGLGERVLLSFHPLALFVVGALGSLAMCIGILLFSRRRQSHQTVSWLALGIGGFALGAAGTAEFLRSSLEANHQVGVVTTGRAQLLDASGRPLVGEAPLLETTVVHLGRSTHGLSPLLSLTEEKWLRTSQVRIVSKMP